MFVPFPPATMQIVKCGDYSSSQMWKFVENDFEIGKMIGTGSAGVIVFSAKHKATGLRVALKYMPMKNTDSWRAMREARSQQQAACDHVVEIYGAYVGSDLSVLALERCEYDLFTKLTKHETPFAEKEARPMFKQARVFFLVFNIFYILILAILDACRDHTLPSESNRASRYQAGELLRDLTRHSETW